MNPLLAAVQLDTIPCEVSFNVHKAMGWARRAFEDGAEYIFFHEGLTADYSPDPMRDGRSLESSEVFGFAALAKKYDGYIALGLNEVWQGRPYISMVLLGPGGIIDVYRKTYLWPNKTQRQTDSFDEWLNAYVPYKEGYRCERGILGSGDGSRVIHVGELRIGCLICADGSQPEAWATFKNDKPDLIFWQINSGNVAKLRMAQERARELRTPLVASNRCGFSYHHFQEGGTCFIADDGHVVNKASEEGEEGVVFANFSDLRVLDEES
jgi:predicted amidohydrolase